MDPITPVTEAASGQFSLYDLRVVVEQVGARCTCSMAVGDAFELKGGKIAIPGDRTFCLYALQAVIPLLPAKQRPTHRNDWMTSDAEVACPDPNCSTRFRITRLGLRRFHHAQTTAVPLGKE